jgi:DNA invertase Pin-like site-specific DNA recombinase
MADSSSYRAEFRSPAEAWADTSTGRPTLAVLGSLADVERDLIRTRTAEGGEPAKETGSAWAAPRNLTPHSRGRRARRQRREPGRTCPKPQQKPFRTSRVSQGALGAPSPFARCATTGWRIYRGIVLTRIDPANWMVIDFREGQPFVC